MPNLVLMFLMLFTTPYQNLVVNAVQLFDFTRISQESFHIPIFQIRIFISFNTCQMKYRRNAHALAVSSEQGKTSSQSCRQV